MRAPSFSAPARSAAVVVALAAATGCGDAAEATSHAAPTAEVVSASARAPLPAPRPVAARRQLDGRAFPDKVLALTWDDGPDVHTLELARYLRAERVAGTFFVVRAWIDGVSSDPGAGRGVFATGHAALPVLGELVRLGHRVGNHTANHVLLDAVPPVEVVRQLREDELALEPWLTGELRAVRAPGGAWSASASAAVDGDPRLADLVGPVRWDIDAKDWETSLYCLSDKPALECEPAAPRGALRVRPEVVARRYVAAIEAAGHGIVLLHDRVGHVGSRYALDIAHLLVPALRAKGYVFAAPVLAFSPPSPRARDASAWAAVDPASVRVADRDGDGHADVCGRSRHGVVCARALPRQGGRPFALGEAEVCAPAPRDRVGAALLADPDTELELGDVDGDRRADLCVVHGAHGIACGLADAAGRFGPLRSWLAEGPHAGDDGAASALMLGDLDGDGRADACVRASAAIACARSAGRAFEPLRAWLAETHDSPIDGSTALGDVDGDGRDDLCFLHEGGVACALSTGHAFGPARGWSVAAAPLVDRAATLVLGDLNDDGRDDLCVHEDAGVACALSTGRGFARASVWLSAKAFPLARDATLALGDASGDGRADLCGLDAAGIDCALAP